MPGMYVHPTEGADLETLALQEARLAEVKAAQDSRRIRDSLADLDEARARKSCK